MDIQTWRINGTNRILVFELYGLFTVLACVQNSQHYGSSISYPMREYLTPGYGYVTTSQPEDLA